MTRYRLWWALCAAVGLLGIGAVLVAPASAQDDESAEQVVLSVSRVDATGDDVVVQGWLVGAEPSQLSASSDGEPLDPVGLRTVGDGLTNEVVAVIDNSASLSNGTVQLAKQALAPLMPGAGASSSLGVVTTGGSARVAVGPTSSLDRIDAGLEGIEPSGASATWDGIVRATELLDDRASSATGTVVLFSATPSLAGTALPSAASAALQAANAELVVVALPFGSEVASLGEIVADVGGSIEVLDNDEQIAGAYDDVAAALAGRFSLVLPETGEPGQLVPLELSVEGAQLKLAYATGRTLDGRADLAAVPAAGGGSLFTSSLVKWLAVLLVILAVVMLSWGVVSLVVPSENDLGRRLEVYDESFGVEDLDDANDGHVSVPIIQRAVEFTGEMAERRGIREKVEVMLERANLPLRAPEAMFFTVVGAALLVVLSFVLSGNLIVALVVGVVAAMLPSAVLNFRIRRRQKEFVQQLPDMLTLLAGTLRAGYSIGQGFESVSTEIADPMGRELRRVVSETRLGRSLEESLEAVAERMDSDDFSWAVMAIKIQREVGGNLAELLLTVADTMTQRERLRREVSTLTAEGRLSAIIIGALPPGLAVVMWFMNPEYISALFSPGLGYVLIIAALVMMGIGFAWMKKTITIEV